MKRLLALSLIASLMAAPVALAQPPATDKPASAKPATQPKRDDKPADKPKDGAQPKKDEQAKPATPSAEEQTKAWDEAAKVGPNHKLLAWFAGEWAAEVKHLTPGQESTDKGTMTHKMAMGDRFLMMDFDGRAHGKFFRGAGIWGYNNTEKRFESVWCDSMGTMITFMTGTADKDGRVFTMTGEMTDPTSDKKKVTMKEVTTITGKETFKSEFFMGTDKVMEIAYTKSKGEKNDKDEKAEEKPKK